MLAVWGQSRSLMPRAAQTPNFLLCLRVTLFSHLNVGNKK
jgi:hypothetical protein